MARWTRGHHHGSNRPLGWSEIIVPVFDREGRSVIGTIDVESEEPNAFNRDFQTLLQACAELIRPLWEV